MERGLVNDVGLLVLARTAVPAQPIGRIVWPDALDHEADRVGEADRVVRRVGCRLSPCGENGDARGNRNIEPSSIRCSTNLPSSTSLSSIGPLIYRNQLRQR